MPQMPPARPVCSCLRRRARRRDGNSSVYSAFETTQTHVLIPSRISAAPLGSLPISFENKGDLAIAVEGDEAMFSQYGVILVTLYPNAQGQS
jgi:hypothetical protein